VTLTLDHGQMHRSHIFRRNTCLSTFETGAKGLCSPGSVHGANWFSNLCNYMKENCFFVGFVMSNVHTYSIFWPNFAIALQSSAIVMVCRLSLCLLSVCDASVLW